MSISLSKQNREANRIYHDKIAHKYERDPRVRLGAMHPNCGKRLSWLQKHYQIRREGSVVVNLGVGTGNIIEKTDKIFGNTIGIDISGNMLQQAKRHSHRLIQADALQLPLRSESVDLIFCTAFLHHVYDLKGLFESIYRVLKQGGIFYSDYDQNKRFYETIKKVPPLLFLARLYKRISDSFIFNKTDDSELRSIHDIAEYHEEFNQGLDPSEIVAIAHEAGFSHAESICHCDSPSLDYPRSGRWIHMACNMILRPLSSDYNSRTKIFSLITVK